MRTEEAQRRALGSLIRREREARGLTKAFVAGRVGHGVDWLTRVESGERRTNVGEYFDIARVVGFDPLQVLREVYG
jgi:transcriptional regulator with XRE-family HTH domain